MAVRACMVRASQEEAFDVMGGSSRNLRDRLSVCLIVALAASVVAIGGPDTAQAFDFLGLWGSDEPPAVSRNAISYSVTFDVVGDSSTRDAIQDASALCRLRKDAPSDGEALARRAAADLGPILDALWGAGYYNATVAIVLGNASLTLTSNN